MTRLLTIIGLLTFATAFIGGTNSNGAVGRGNAVALQENVDALRNVIGESDITAEIVDLTLKNDKDSSVLVLSIRTASYGTRAFVPDLASFTRELESVLAEQGTDVDVLLIEVLSEDNPGTVIQIQ